MEDGPRLREAVHRWALAEGTLLDPQQLDGVVAEEADLLVLLASSSRQV